MTELLITGVLFLGTALQAWTALQEMLRTHAHAIDESIVESDLTREIPVWQVFRRREAARQLRRMRTPEVDRDITHVNRVFWGWMLLTLGTGAAFVRVLFV